MARPAWIRIDYQTTTVPAAAAEMIRRYGLTVGFAKSHERRLRASQELGEHFWASVCEKITKRQERELQRVTADEADPFEGLVECANCGRPELDCPCQHGEPPDPFEGLV